MVLGLDLRGGAYLLYEIDQKDYIQKRMKQLEGEIRTALREDPADRYTRVLVFRAKPLRCGSAI